jgi:hypothetical protein
VVEDGGVRVGPGITVDRRRPKFSPRTRAKDESRSGSRVRSRRPGLFELVLADHRPILTEIHRSHRNPFAIAVRMAATKRHGNLLTGYPLTTPESSGFHPIGPFTVSVFSSRESERPTTHNWNHFMFCTPLFFQGSAIPPKKKSRCRPTGSHKGKEQPHPAAAGSGAIAWGVGLVAVGGKKS